MITAPIFIVGSSRSGTCLLGEILKKHSQIHCLIEYPKIFKQVQYLSYHLELHTDPNIVNELQQLYIKSWKKIWRKCATCSSSCQKIQRQKSHWLSPCYKPKNIKRYADKSHPNLINIDVLTSIFPQAQFLHIYRDARDVVTSMLRYDRLKRRFSSKIKITAHSSWPQPWYGVRNLQHYQDWQSWSIEKKMAHAWESRIIEGFRYSEKLSNSLWLDIRYEDLLQNPQQIVRNIFEFIDLPYEENTHTHIRSSNSNKWKKYLSESQVLEVLENAPSLRKLGYL